MPTEHISYEDSAAYEKEFESPSPLADVAQNFVEGTGEPLAAEQPWLEGASLDDADEYLIDAEGGELEGWQGEEQGGELPLDLMTLRQHYQSWTPNQQQAFVADLTVEQLQELERQDAQLQTRAKLEELAQFHDNRNAWQAERAQLAEQQQVEQEAEGHAVFESWIEQARVESKTSATSEQLDEWARGWLDFEAHELRAQGYDAATVQEHVYTPDNIAQKVWDVAQESAAAESRKYALSHLRARGG